MKPKLLASLFLLFAVSPSALAARQWHTGTLTESEQQKVTEGSTTTKNTDGIAKNKGNKTDYSQNTTYNTTDNQETYQIYTIQSGGKTYVASQHLFFPWSKTANVNVGETVKFAVERNKLYILDDDGKEYKTTVKNVRMSPPQH